MIQVDTKFSLIRRGDDESIYFVVQHTCKKPHYEEDEATKGRCFIAGISTIEGRFSIYSVIHAGKNPYGCNTTINKETINKIKFMLGIS